MCRLDRSHIKTPFNEGPVCVMNTSFHYISSNPTQCTPTKAWVWAEGQVLKEQWGLKNLESPGKGNGEEQKWDRERRHGIREMVRGCVYYIQWNPINIFWKLELQILWVSFSWMSKKGKNFSSGLREVGQRYYLKGSVLKRLELAEISGCYRFLQAME